jgi:hypothetical protein
MGPANEQHLHVLAVLARRRARRTAVNSGTEEVAAASPLAEAQRSFRRERSEQLFAPQAYFFWAVCGESEVARLRH